MAGNRGEVAAAPPAAWRSRRAWIGAALVAALAHASGGARADAPAAPVGLSGAFGSFTITPSRILFEGPTRNAEITLVNSGPRPASYRVLMTNMRMDANGTLAPIDSAGPGEAFADRWIRFSPHQVELQPGVPQTIRLQLQAPSGDVTGELRSHLVVRAIPSLDPADSSGASPQGIRTALTPVYGVAIPVIVRRGSTGVGVSIDSLRIDRTSDASPWLAFTLRRMGNRSVYGHLEADLLDGPTPRTLGALRGVAVYVPNDVRRIEIPLTPGPAGLPRSGRVRVRYRDAESNFRVLAEAELALP